MIFKVSVYTLSKLIYTELIYGFQEPELLIVLWGCSEKTKEVNINFNSKLLNTNITNITLKESFLFYNSFLNLKTSELNGMF